jgi:hypothetical protein
MKNLPVDNQTFTEIINRQMLYVDKTEYIHRLITGQHTCFLSRPRRFGKSLLLDTVGAVFSGNKDIFKGLYIHSTDYAFPRHPVIRFNMNEFDSSSPQLLEGEIIDSIIEQAENEEITVKGVSHLSYLSHLVHRLERKYQKLSNESKDPSKNYQPKVVILVDDYDAPITKHIGDLNLALANRNVIHDFLANFKNLDGLLRFIFVTGNSGFGLAYTECGPDNLNDISIKEKYSGICGFTINEFDHYFSDRLEDTLKVMKKNRCYTSDKDVTTLRTEIIDWYGGYNWADNFKGEAEANLVMNPFSLLNFFENKLFDQYWYKSGRPSHLSYLMQRNPLDYLQPLLDDFQRGNILYVDFSKLTPAIVLFHAGYLTIDKSYFLTDPDYGIKQHYYSLRLPNGEVKKAYRNDCLLTIFNKDKNQFLNLGQELYPAFLEKDVKVVADTFSKILSGITDYQPIQNEKYYQSLIHSALFGLGFEILDDWIRRFLSEIVLSLPDGVHLIIEVRYEKAKDSVDDSDLEKELSMLIEKAKTSLKARDYDGPWKLKATKILKMALAIYDRNDVMVEFIDDNTSLSSKKKTPGKRSSLHPKKTK